MIHALARFFRGIHYALGITAPPRDADPAQEKNFVMLWFGLLAAIGGSVAVIAYLFTT